MEVTADWHELVVPRRGMQPEAAIHCPLPRSRKSATTYVVDARYNYANIVIINYDKIASIVANKLKYIKIFCRQDE